ncbi:asparagine synthetase 3 [Actinidia rufa]|uniref:Asparagine synthetase 3 n=1 Tax=Actinidia rufa TaxID=165716 RepID=A0A7J0E3M3_9ERIC|nr:asparagine synthetase 3 [Actinidia rufa]
MPQVEIEEAILDLGGRSVFDLSPINKAVVKRLMTDVPFGVLLSGGLDSSLVAAVASRHLAESEAACQWGSQLHTFCIGLKGSPDLKAAREVADYLGTRHHEFHFTVQDGIDALEEVIYYIETYDVITIRASTPMFLMSRKMKSLGVKMVISGEGSDEIFGGYLYFHKAPNKEDFSRGNMSQKEQFSDGVGYSWIDGLKDHANLHVTDAMLSHAGFIYPENTPTTKEAYYYRTIFERFFPKNSARSTVPGGPSVACSTAKAVEWDAARSKNLDPSGRAALGVHASAYKEAAEANNASVINGPPQKQREGVVEKTATVA